MSRVSLKIATTLVPSAADTKLKGTPRSSTNLYLRYVALSSISILFAIIMHGMSGAWCLISLYQPFKFWYVTFLEASKTRIAADAPK
jgi:hypothetical protein